MKNEALDMLAIVNHGPEDYRLERIARPKAKADELVISIAACGVCASDDKCHSGAGMFWGGSGNPPWVKAPVVPGHELFGYVVETGEGAEEHFGVKVGDRVTAEQIVPCGKCKFCTSESTGCAKCTTSSAFNATLPMRDGRIHATDLHRTRP